MNVNKFLFLIPIITFFYFSQNKKEDVYFIVNDSHKSYTLGDKIKNKDLKSLEIYSILNLYDRVEYEKRHKKKNKEKKKKKGKYITPFELLPGKIVNTLSFRVKNNKSEIINHCDIHKQKLKIIDYNWLIVNSWKENNNNILFRNLYFLIKQEDNQYIKYEVKRTIIAH